LFFAKNVDEPSDSLLNLGVALAVVALESMWMIQMPSGENKRSEWVFHLPWTMPASMPVLNPSGWLHTMKYMMPGMGREKSNAGSSEIKRASTPLR